MNSLDLLGKHMGETQPSVSSRRNAPGFDGESLFKEQFSQHVNAYTSQVKQLDITRERKAVDTDVDVPKTTVAAQQKNNEGINQPSAERQLDSRDSETRPAHNVHRERDASSFQSSQVKPPSSPIKHPSQARQDQTRPDSQTQPDSQPPSASPSNARPIESTVNQTEGIATGAGTDIGLITKELEVDQPGIVDMVKHNNDLGEAITPTRFSLGVLSPSLSPSSENVADQAVGPISQELTRSLIRANNLNASPHPLTQTMMVSDTPDIDAELLKTVTTPLGLQAATLKGEAPVELSGPAQLITGTKAPEPLGQGSVSPLLPTSQSMTNGATPAINPIDAPMLAQTSVAFQKALQANQQTNMGNHAAMTSLGASPNGATVSDLATHTSELLSGQATSVADKVSTAPAQTNARFSVNIQFGRAEWATNVAAKVAKMAAQNLNMAEIQLDPPELGPLQVRVQVNNDQASVTFSAQSAQVRDALEQGNQKLRDLFEGEGLDLVDVDVRDQQQQQSEDELDSEQTGEQNYLSDPETETQVSTHDGSGVSAVVDVGVDDFV